MKRNARFCLDTFRKPGPTQIIHMLYMEQLTRDEYPRVYAEVLSALILQLALRFY